ncbi:MAG: flagellar motor protein MotB [Pseudomonadales bacterium]|nr:flagellar motor protein MotB [Halioglobus sp.]MCP5120947.1 flagellar motor protein MotB [Pseudomonadales bacterium]MCP5194389.1 flagellar motor protein MotB [Pseudomonadales bacterium]
MPMIEEDEAAPGAPAWMATFADLMSLLMCFFVLLLSFSEMDLQKYKQVAGSMKNAFGVQNQVKVMDIPKGTSIIAQEFSPGRPQPTQVDTVNQFTTETTKPSLQVGNPTALTADGKEVDSEQFKQLVEEKVKQLKEKTREDAEKLRDLLGKEIDEGKIDIESHNRSITIRIREKGSFPSGSADLNPDFIPAIGALRGALQDISGKIAVEGHTDDVPITSGKFRSNWDLSSSRALSVTHELVNDNVLESDRFMVVGRADTQPFKPNTSDENRAYNRRVEIVIRQGFDDSTLTDIKQLQRDNPDVMDELGIDADIMPEDPGTL